ncbi:MAG: FMN-binding protein [Clostridiaceae bacterium]|nr:FMN-binding protein [Clostridiaceae bacterium]
MGLVLALSSGLVLSGCTATEEPKEEVVAAEETVVEEVVDATASYEDGRYRGIYEDRGVQQVSIQFHVEDNILTDLSYRHLFHGGNDYRQIEEGHELYPVVVQHQQILEYLEGKPVEAMYDLYTPGDMVEDIDGFTGATIRGSKILSAMQDGLNRGLYTPAGDFSRDLGGYEDGRYRGVFGDRGDQQVSIQFHLEDNVLTDLSYRHLYHSGNDYRQIEEGHELYPVVVQHQDMLDYLEGKPLEAIFDLYTPGDFIEDIDGFTGATIRGNKVLSAIRDGLNRGLYTPAGDFSRDLEAYEDGRYRGIFGDRGAQQVSIQFHLEDNHIKDLSYRHLYHSGNDYRQIEEGHELYPVVVQHQHILEYLEGKPLATIFDLYTPGDFVEDIDSFTGATIRGNKILSAIKDGLNRGIY